jgi:hypothetical protein
MGLPAAAVGAVVGAVAALTGTRNIRHMATPAAALVRAAEQRWGSNPSAQGPVYYDTVVYHQHHHSHHNHDHHNHNHNHHGSDSSVSGSNSRTATTVAPSGDGAALAHAFFSCGAFQGERLLLARTGLGQRLVNVPSSKLSKFHTAGGGVGSSSNSKKHFETNLPNRLHVGDQFMFWRLAEADALSAVLDGGGDSVIYLGRSEDGREISFGTAIAPRGIRPDDIWGEYYLRPLSLPAVLSDPRVRLPFLAPCSGGWAVDLVPVLRGGGESARFCVLPRLCNPIRHLRACFS